MKRVNQNLLKVFHGPNNTGGIGYRLSRLQRERGMASDFWTLEDHPRKKQWDVCLHLDKKSGIYVFISRIAMFLFCLVNYNVFHFYFGESLLPFNLDLPFLKLFRKKIVMTYCGSDIRLFRVDLSRHGFPELLKEAGYTERQDRLKLIKMRWHRLWVNKITAPRNLYGYARTVFSEEMISQVWINNIDIFSGYGKEPLPAPHNMKKRLLVVHAPTSRQIKGTRIIEKTVLQLQSEGLKFDYQRIEGRTYPEAIALIKRADIVIDQIIIGGIGNLGFESLSMGKTLCVYVIDEIVDMLGSNLPLLNSNVYNLKDQLRLAITDPSLRKRFFMEGPAFVKKHIDLARILDEIEKLYGLTLG